MCRFSGGQFVSNYSFLSEHCRFSFASVVIPFFYFPFFSPHCFCWFNCLISLCYVQLLFLPVTALSCGSVTWLVSSCWSFSFTLSYHKPHIQLNALLAYLSGSLATLLQLHRPQYYWLVRCFLSAVFVHWLLHIISSSGGFHQFGQHSTF